MTDMKRGIVRAVGGVLATKERSDERVEHTMSELDGQDV